MPGSSKYQVCVVKLLDGEEYSVKLNVEQTYGVSLFDNVCSYLQVNEKEYFCLRFVHPKDKMYSWLNLRKTLKRQLKEGPYIFYFFVKFFPPDPCTLQEDVTRYLFVLAIRDLVLHGILDCSLHYKLLLASYIIQAEFGDYSETLTESNYLEGISFFPSQLQTPDVVAHLVEYHKRHEGLKPEEVEIQYLKIIKDLPMYGVEIHDVRDSELHDYIIGISFRGLHLYQADNEIHVIFWQELVSASFFKKSISIKIFVTGGTSRILTYKCNSRTSTKRLYRSIVEFHTFFRRPIPLPPVPGYSLSSKFRFNGRKTYLQLKNTLQPGSSLMETSHSLSGRASLPSTLYQERDLRHINTSIPIQTSTDFSISDDSSSSITNDKVSLAPSLQYHTQMVEAQFDEWGRIAPSTITYSTQPTDPYQPLSSGRNDGAQRRHDSYEPVMIA